MARSSKEYESSTLAISSSSYDAVNMTYDQHVTRFMFKFAEQPRLVKKFNEIFTPNSTLEDMFKFLHSLEETKEALQPTMTFSLKSMEAAHAYWAHANVCAKSKDRDHALLFYNLSLCEAPHPVMIVDGKQWGQEKSKATNSSSETASTDVTYEYEDDWGIYTALSHAYEGRAHVLFSLKQYQKCREDIDRVLALGCPPTVQAKLEDLKTECERLGSSDIVQTEPLGTDDSVSFLYRSPEPPSLENPNTSYPSFSSAVSFACNEKYGRHMVANRDIAPGEFVSVDKAYSVVLYPKYLKDYCTICLKRAPAPLPCPNCSTVIFCSEKCRLNGLGGCHKVECPILSTLNRLGMCSHAALVMRLFAEMGYTNMKSMVPPLREKASSTNIATISLNDEGVFDSANYRSVFNLVTNLDKRSVGDLMRRTMEAYVLLQLLVHSDEYFTDSFGNQIDPKEEELIFTGAMLMHHLMISWCNADNITEMQHAKMDSSASPIVPYAIGLFPSTSILNHECYTTCACVSYGTIEVMRACRRIPAGTQITRQYADLYRTSMEERVNILKKRYHFVCSCIACLKKWPHNLTSDLTYDLRCVACNKAVDKLTKKCTDCDIIYNRQGPLADRPEIITYDYSVVKDRMDDAIHRCLKTPFDFGRSDDIPDHLKNLKDLLHLYEEYAVLPTHGHVTVQSLLHAFHLREGTSAHVKTACASGCVHSWKNPAVTLSVSGKSGCSQILPSQ